jgi:hypothetical protein
MKGYKSYGPKPLIGSDAPDAFYLGRYRDEKTGRVVGPKIQMPGNEPIIIIGSNRRGKDAGVSFDGHARTVGAPPRRRGSR